MSLTVKNVNLIRKTDISAEAAEAFLIEALTACTGSAPGNVEWRSVNRTIRGRPKGEEITNIQSWQPTGMIDVRRISVESYTLNIDAVLELSSARVSFSVRNLPGEGSLEFRIDNTRLKGASMEIYAPHEPADAVVNLFNAHFKEAG